MIIYKVKGHNINMHKLSYGHDTNLNLKVNSHIPVTNNHFISKIVSCVYVVL